MNIVKWWIDPGLDGDPYADMPYLYGPGLSSFNSIHIGAGEHDPEKGGLYFEEGGDEAGLEARRAIGAPDGAKERKKWALANDSKEKWSSSTAKRTASTSSTPISTSRISRCACRGSRCRS